MTTYIYIKKPKQIFGSKKSKVKKAQAEKLARDSREATLGK